MVYELVEENGRQVVRARKVSLGGVYNNQVEIVPNGSEVQAGAKVVVTTAERLTDGMVVRAVDDETDSAATLAEAK
jgi:hypothetical protein